MMLYFRYIVYLLVAVGISSANAGAYEDFFSAILRDDGRAVSALLQRGLDPNTRDENSQVGLYLALREDAAAAAEALLAHPGLEIDAANPAGETPLMMAALKGRLDGARRLLARGAQVNRPGWSPLHYAASGPEPQLLQLLLDRGGAVDAPSPNGSTPLMMAARYGSEDAVDLLLRRGANPRLRNQLDLDAADFARLDGRDRLADRLAKLTAR
jgi:ankyrin repeat protein